MKAITLSITGHETNLKYLGDRDQIFESVFAHYNELVLIYRWGVKELTTAWADAASRYLYFYAYPLNKFVLTVV